MKYRSNITGEPSFHSILPAFIKYFRFLKMNGRTILTNGNAN